MLTWPVRCLGCALAGMAAADGWRAVAVGAMLAAVTTPKVWKS